jgi:3-methyladenine DNA glycosylase/8-oxoguanine DNA glycosylase
VHALACSVVSGDRDLENLKDPDLPAEQVREALLSIKGIGDYAAASIMMLLGRYDYVPVDSWGLRLASQAWSLDQPVTVAQVEAAFERWGRWKGLAYWLWDWSYSGGE